MGGRQSRDGKCFFGLALRAVPLEEEEARRIPPGGRPNALRWTGSGVKVCVLGPL